MDAGPRTCRVRFIARSVFLGESEEREGRQMKDGKEGQGRERERERVPQPMPGPECKLTKVTM